MSVRPLDKPFMLARFGADGSGAEPENRSYLPPATVGIARVSPSSA